MRDGICGYQLCSSAQINAQLPIFSVKNAHNDLPEGDSDIMFGSLCFALPAKDTFTCWKKGDGAA